MLDFYVSKESRVAEIGLPTGTNIISVVGFVASSSSSSSGLIGMFERSGKHFIK